MSLGAAGVGAVGDECDPLPCARQLGDFARVYDNNPAGRQALLDRYEDWFGERWWMLPNPTYGSWEPALFDNNWRQPREARRAAKRAALDVAP